jgi:micrococcal nuclease
MMGISNLVALFLATFFIVCAGCDKAKTSTRTASVAQTIVVADGLDAPPVSRADIATLSQPLDGDIVAESEVHGEHSTPAIDSFRNLSDSSETSAISDDEVDSVATTDDDLRTSAVDPLRQWSSHSGKYKVEAVLIGLSKEAVTLERRDGEIVVVRIEKLSDDDVRYLTLFQVDLIGKCVGITDGDTVTVLDSDNKQVKIRLEGIDAPENHQDFGSESRHRTGKLVFQKDVRIQRRGLDKYGRTLGHVFVDNLWVNLALVKEGMAWHYKKYSADPRLADAEDVARKQRIGVWSRNDTIAPWNFRDKPKPQPVVTIPKPARPKPPPTDVTPRVRDYDSTGERTATGIPIHTGPRGGMFHYSKNGKKVYERKKK